MTSNEPGYSRDASVRNSVIGVRSVGLRSILSSVDVQKTGNYVIVPPDGGWGWMVVFSAFMCNMITDAVAYCFALFLDGITRDMNCTMTVASVTTSVLTTLYYLLGPIFCALTNRFGFRIICLIGTLSSVVAFLSASFVSNVVVFILIVGVIGGSAFSMIYITSIIIVGFYFERWRALATAISVTGSAVGVILFPMFIGALDQFSWRTHFLCVSGLFGICALCALTYRPLHPVEITSQDTGRSFEVITEKISERSEDVDHFEVETGRGNRYHNKMYPTSADIHGSGSVTISMASASAITSLSKRSKTKPQKRRLPLATSVSAPDRMSYDAENKTLMQRCCPCCSRDKETVQSKFKSVILTRPLYRDDIFFHGSLMTLPDYSTKSRATMKPSIDYHMSVTRMSTAQDITDQETKCVCCPQSVKRILATMFDVSLLRKLSFFALMVSGFFAAVGLYIPYIYIIDMNVKAGISATHARFLLSVMGFSNAAGRIACGVVSFSPRIKAITVLQVALLISGASIVLLPFVPNIIAQYICCSIFGFTIAPNSALRSIVIVDLYGLQNLTNAFGIAILFQGLACIVSLPSAGVLKDHTGSYYAVMIFAGSNIVLSGLLMFVVAVLHKKERRGFRGMDRMAASGSVRQKRSPKGGANVANQRRI